jgi:hypothetical protein
MEKLMHIGAHKLFALTPEGDVLVDAINLLLHYDIKGIKLQMFLVMAACWTSKHMFFKKDLFDTRCLGCMRTEMPENHLCSSSYEL